MTVVRMTLVRVSLCAGFLTKGNLCKSGRYIGAFLNVSATDKL